MPPDEDPGLVIGIDARAVVEVPAGRGRYVRELVRALAGRPDRHRYVLYARSEWDEPLDDRFAWRTLAARDPWWHLRAARDAGRRCDVFLSTNSYLTAWFLRIPSVPVVYDMATFDSSLAPRRRSVVIERLTLGLAVRRAAALLAISQSTRDDLVRRFPRAAGKVVVAPLAAAPSPEPVPADGALIAGLPPSFVLAVGTVEPRKNLPRLVEAYSSLPAALRDRHHLVVAGPPGWEEGETRSALRSLGDQCHVLGYVSDGALGELYRRCALFCYPSLYEGFGLPVLEAMREGAAVVTSDRSSLPEVGGDAAEYVDPTDVPAIAAALERLLDDPERRAELGRRGRERAAGFSWERTAAQTLSVLEDVVGARAGRRGG